jgi:hypothetical protein
MTLTTAQLERCIDIMNKLCSRNISAMFAQPVDPLRDDCTDYFDVIKHPMDLGTIKTKLAMNQYKSVSEWKSDVNLVWANSALYNSKSSLLRLITKDLSDLFHKLTSTFSDSPQNDWNDELQALGNEMGQLMKELTAPPASADDSGAPGAHRGKGSAGGRLFGTDELLKLTHEINSIRDIEKLCQLTELLKEQESDIEDNGEDLDVDLNTLRLPTLIMLRKKVDELLKK